MKSRNAARTIDALWLAMLAATAVSWWIGERGTGLGTAGPLAIVLGLSLVKGLAIALEFMALRGAPAVWRRFVVGWLLVVTGAIAVLAIAR